MVMLYYDGGGESESFLNPVFFQEASLGEPV